MRTLLFLCLLGMAIAFVLLFLMVSPQTRRLRERFHIWKLRRLAGRLNAVMVAATAVQILDRPGGFHFQGQFTLDPGNIAAGGREVETVAVPGAQIGDGVIICPRPTMGLLVGFARVSAAGAIEFILENNTAGAIDLGATIFDFYILRGTTGPLR